ncbi:DUF805 domain-containing protein [Aquibium microcysteis]|uniref:DUF805 domain-containing protein n=1 Tax=Aquibium microcysteis TaxID=675281 RepID=UPI00165CFC39|nr:DUF805 domain-containing protein [Aquibium microcysteis]
MKGDVLYFDAERGIGFASGDDGNRYHFDRADLPAGFSPQKGMRIAFTPSGNRAGAIVPQGGIAAAPQTAVPAAPAAAGPTQAVAGRQARPAGAVPPVEAAPTRAVPSVAAAPAPGAPLAGARPLSLFGHFRSCVTAGYVRFRGRATRREYWGFVLFSVLAVLAVALAALILDASVGNLDRDEPIALAILAPLAVLALVLPSVAVTVRRIHDVGLSGWFVLLGLIPSVGSLIILVFALIPSQKRPNRWGEVPADVL